MKSALAQPQSYLEALTPLLLVVLVFFTYNLLIDAFVSCRTKWGAGCQSINITRLFSEKNLCCLVPAGPIKATVIQWRFLWLFMVGLNILACAATIVIGIYIVQRVLAGRSRRYQQVFAGSIILLTLLAFYIFLSREPNLSSLVNCRDNYPTNRLVNQFLACTVTSEMPSVIAVSNWIIAFSYMAAFLLVLLSVAILWPVAKERRTSELEISERIKLLRILLYTGMFQLVISTLRLSATFHWATSFFLSQDENNPAAATAMVKSLERLASTLSSIEAATYTLILIAIYVPAIFILRNRAYLLISQEDCPTPPSREKWLEERGLNISVSAYIPRMAALLAPLLAGPLGDMVARFIQ
jgi:hypothetical protein